MTETTQTYFALEPESEETGNGFYSALNYIGENANTQYGKGKLFERLIRTYLLEDPFYQKRFSEVYLWSEWAEHRPEFDGVDIGIDLNILVIIEVNFFFLAGADQPFGIPVLPRTSAASYGLRNLDTLFEKLPKYVVSMPIVIDIAAFSNIQRRVASRVMIKRLTFLALQRSAMSIE